MLEIEHKGHRERQGIEKIARIRGKMLRIMIIYLLERNTCWINGSKNLPPRRNHSQLPLKQIIRGVLMLPSHRRTAKKDFSSYQERIIKLFMVFQSSDLFPTASVKKTISWEHFRIRLPLGIHSNFNHTDLNLIK